MRNYNDYKSDPNREDLTKEEISKVEWIKYKIVVPTEEDRNELMEVFEHIHYSDVDSYYVGVNQISHEYLDDDVEPGSKNNIIVDKDLYNRLNG